MNIFKLILIAFFTIVVSACGDSSENNMEASVNEMTPEMEAAAEEARQEAARQAQELEDLENQ